MCQEKVFIISNILKINIDKIATKEMIIACLYFPPVAASTTILNNIGIIMAIALYTKEIINLNMTNFFDFFKTNLVTSLGFFITLTT